jgi:hypothetical protein
VIRPAPDLPAIRLLQVGLHVSAQRGDETKSGDDDTTHANLRKYDRLNPLEVEPAVLLHP